MTVTKFLAAFQLQLGGDQPYQGNTTSQYLLDAVIAQNLQVTTSLANGTGTGNADTIIRQVRLLAASANETLNFFDGSVLDIFGGATALQSIKYLAIYQTTNADATTAASSITIGNAASNALVMNLGGTTPTYTITNNGMPFLAGQQAGYTVDGTHKNLKITNNDASNEATYILVVAGNHV